MEAPDLAVGLKTQTDEQDTRPHLSLVPQPTEDLLFWEPLVEAHAAALEVGEDDSFFEITQAYLTSATNPNKAGLLLGTLLTSDSLQIRATGQDLAEGVLEMSEKKAAPLIKEVFCNDDAGRQILEIARDYDEEAITRLVLNGMKAKWWEKRQGLVARLDELRAAQLDNL